MADSAGYRFLRITLDPNLQGTTVVEMIAHELQHALEIVRAPEVTDVDTLRALYQRIGYQRERNGQRDEWETTDAQRVAERVATELKEARKALLLARR